MKKPDISEETKEKITAALVLSLGILSYALLCVFWVLGIISALASVILGFYYGKLTSKTNRVVVTGMVMSAMNLAVVILFLIFAASYLGTLNINPFK